MIRGTIVVAGTARGDALVTHEPLSFWGGYDQLTGEIIDRRHPLSGHNAKDRILVIPASRGSSTTTAVLLEAVRNGTAPAAIICVGADRFFALASIVAGEMYGRSFAVISVTPDEFEMIPDGALLQVHADGVVQVTA